MSAGTDVAIVGMACLFPGAPDLATFAKNLRSGFDATSEVPRDRWDPIFYHTQPYGAPDKPDGAADRASDRLYCKRGGFVDEHALFDAVAHGVMPIAAAAAEPDQLLALEVAYRAFLDSGLGDRDFDRSRAGVILGRGGYPGPGRIRLDQHLRGAEQLVRAIKRLMPDVDEQQLSKAKREFQDQLASARADAAIGLVPNLAASRIAHRLDLSGPAFTVDAACASALIAVEQATFALRSKRLDLVLCGGVHFAQDESFWSVFCQLGALSRSEKIRPFSAKADGLLIGEGAGIVALMRREQAEERGLRIYALIRGVGSASDGRSGGLMSPSVEGQVAALASAWRDAELDPESVEMIEAHGTATPAGDAAELDTLRRIFGQANTVTRAALGSVKSMIGHAMPAAGAAGLIKAALGLHERTIFPSLFAEEPHPALAATRFRIPAQAEPWESSQARRAGVNAFGFGGINAHLVLEEAAGGGATRTQISLPASFAKSTAGGKRPPRILLFAASDRESLVRMLDSCATARLQSTSVIREGEGRARIAVVDATAVKIAKAKDIVLRNKPWRGREGIYYGAEANLAEGGIAFLYPGIDAAPDSLADSIEEQGVALIEAGQAITRSLHELGIRPALALGHSVGEWSAMVASGMVTERELAPLLERARSESLEVPGVAFAAVGSSIDRVRPLLSGLSEIVVSHDNCPHQVILCGIDRSIDEALLRARAAGLLAQKLPFRSGFHSPLFEPHLGVHRKTLSALELRRPAFPLWSATTCAPYPHDAASIRALAVRHLLEPVRFRELVQKLQQTGTRLFVQVGPGSAVKLLGDTLRGEPHAAIAASTNDPEQLWPVAALLFAEGASIHLKSESATRLKLKLGVPIIDINLLIPRKSQSSDPIELAFGELLDEVKKASGEVMGALAEKPAATSFPRRVLRRLSVETHPWLLDHTFFRQPPGWPNASDRHPVVPMTSTIEMMIEEARALMPGRVVIAVEQVRAVRWLAVGSPLEVAFDLSLDAANPNRVRVEAVGYAEATIVFAARYPSAAEAPQGQRSRDPDNMDANDLYTQRWMFHGPQFQGVRQIGPLRPDGIEGELEAQPAPGALLDNAGQLYGFWVMRSVDRDRLAMPASIERLQFFATPPPVGSRVRCEVKIRALEEKRVIADLTLSYERHTWCSIVGWEDRRFESDERLWNVLLWPERSMLSELVEPGVVCFRDSYRSAPTREQLYRRYLGESERAEYVSQPPREQRAFIARRIAAKDLIRAQLKEVGMQTMFPVEIQIKAQADGSLLAVDARGQKTRITTEHSGDVTTARLAPRPGDLS